MIKRLNKFLKKYNYKAGIVPFKRLKEIQDEISNFYNNKNIDEDIYKFYLSDFSYNVKKDSFKPESVVIIAVPRPQNRIYFNIEGRRIPVMVPPVYINHKSTNQKIKEVLNCFLSGTEYEVLPARLPDKLLAAYSGLSKYGKNNISYIEDFGSFFYLFSFLSNIDCAYDNWHEKQVLEGCPECKACLKSCPTGAITAGRFLIRAERCLTFFNEEPGNFPEWVNPHSHNCIVGCMKCQIVCPYNEPFIDWIEDSEEFSEEETKIILQDMPVEKFPASIIKKINLLSLEDYAGVLARNLKALL